MRKIIFLLVLLCVLSCGKKKVFVLNGYFYGENSSKVFYFDQNKLTVFDFELENSILHKDSKQEGEVLLIDNMRFKFDTEKDRIEVKKKGENFFLKPFDFRENDISRLLGTSWYYIDEDKVTHYIRFNKDEIKSYFKDNGEPFAQEGFSYYKQSKLFERFIRYNSEITIYITNHDKEKLECLYLIEGQGFDKITFKKKFSENLKNGRLLGKWSRTNDTRLINKATKLDYMNGKRNLDSIKELIDYSNLEFFDKKIVRYLNNGGNKKKIIYNSNCAIPGFVFIDNIDFQNQYFEIVEISKDTLSLKISSPKYHFDYVRVKQ